MPKYVCELQKKIEQKSTSKQMTRGTTRTLSA